MPQLRAAFIIVLFLWLASPANAESAIPIEDIRTVYATHCADCHESDGRGREYRSSGISIPDFSSATWMQKKSPTELKLGIFLGKGEDMPPFEGEITEAEAVALVSFIRSLSGLSTAAGNRPRAEFNRELVQLNREWDKLRLEWNRVFSEFETAFVGSPSRTKATHVRDVK